MMKSNASTAVQAQSSFQVSSAPAKQKLAVVDFLEFAIQINRSGEWMRDGQGSFGSISSSSLPPLDQVTTCSDEMPDDISSVSSCSLDGDQERDCADFPEKASSPRSIFKEYWGSQDNRQHKLHRPLPTDISQAITKLLFEEDTPNQNVYEEILREREENSKPGIVPKRRCIFANHYRSHSTPALRTTQKCFDLRKINSTSALGRKPAQSCLRHGRYGSGPQQSRRTSECARSENSVRFNQKVEITLFQPSLDCYAEEGWSDYFAYR